MKGRHLYEASEHYFLLNYNTRIYSTTFHFNCFCLVLLHYNTWFIAL